MCRCGFPGIGATFRGSCDKDYSMLGSIGVPLEPSYGGSHRMSVAQRQSNRFVSLQDQVGCIITRLLYVV